MGTWSLCNHKTLNGKSLSRGAGRPRRQGVKETPTVLGWGVSDVSCRSAARLEKEIWRWGDMD